MKYVSRIFEYMESILNSIYSIFVGKFYQTLSIDFMTVGF